MRRLLPAIITILFILSPLLTQCDVSDKTPGEPALIPESAQVVTFSGITWSDVKFQHAQHSERLNGMCIKCHDHQTIAGQTHWYCRSCHTAGTDTEKLCDPVVQHGCIMTQCNNCHEVKGENPGLTCADCHAGGVKTADTGGDTKPTATITLPSGNITIIKGQSVTFSGSVSSGDAPLSYLWNFGGAVANQTVLNPSAVTFATSGVYTVVFTVTDKDGDSSTDSVVLTVNDTGGQPQGFIEAHIDSIDQKSEVDHWPLTIKATGNIVIDVRAFEGCTNTGKWAADYFGDGKANNWLMSNIYLFTDNGTLVDSRTGLGLPDDLPGDGGIGLSHYYRSYRNPYLARNISPGYYVLAIGSYPLSQADAWAKVNTDGSSWTVQHNGSPSYNKYRISIEYRPQ